MLKRFAAAAAVSLAIISTLGFQRGQRVVAGVTEGIVYSRPQGTPLRLDVYRPAERDHYPVVLLVHGGSWRIGSRASFGEVATRFAEEGFVAVSIDYRLTPDDARWPQPLHDVSAALEWTIDNASRFGGDPERIGVLGSSAGGHLALSAAARHDTIDAVAAWSPPTDLRSLHPDTLTADIERLMGCSPWVCPARYRKASPAAMLHAGSAPTFLASSDQEFIPSAQHTALIERLEDLGIDHEDKVVAGRDHGMDLVDDVLPATIAFLRERLAR